MNAIKQSALLIAVLAGLTCQSCVAGPMLDRIREQRALVDAQDNQAQNAPWLPQNVRLLKDISYGSHRLQKLDVYLPLQAIDAPVILMVHGGAWRIGDKAGRTVVENKVKRWVTRGFIFISINYRMLPQTDPLQQAVDVAAALAFAQRQAKVWGGDPEKFILIGHSAGAHLAALLAAMPVKALHAEIRPWLGTILLDSAALDVPEVMNRRHYRLYDNAFGALPKYWNAVSPMHAMSAVTVPILAVCSSRREDACPPAKMFAAKAQSFGSRASVLEQDFSHRDINDKLGVENAYTAAVEKFMGTLDSTVMRALSMSPIAGSK